MKKKIIIGIILAILGIVLIINSQIRILEISLSPSGTEVNINLITGIALLIFGVILMHNGGRNYAKEALDNRKYVDNPKEMLSIAKKLGYELRESSKEGKKVYNGKQVIATIPTNHARISKGASRSILEALATGESSFRRTA